MKLNKSTILIVLAINFVFFLSFQNVFGQEISKIKNSATSAAELVDSFQSGLMTEEEADARIDNLSVQLSKNSNSAAFIIVYCGKICSYGEVEAHLRGIEATLTFKKLDRKRFIIISGGFREETTSELWLVRENACPPKPISTVNISKVKFKGMFKKQKVFYHFTGG